MYWWWLQQWQSRLLALLQERQQLRTQNQTHALTAISSTVASPQLKPQWSLNFFLKDGLVTVAAIVLYGQLESLAMRSAFSKVKSKLRCRD